MLDYLTSPWLRKACIFSFLCSDVVLRLCNRPSVRPAVPCAILSVKDVMHKSCRHCNLPCSTQGGVLVKSTDSQCTTCITHSHTEPKIDGIATDMISSLK